MKTRSIRSRLIQFMLAATTIPLLLSLMITHMYTRESVRDQTVEENVRLIYQGKTNLINYLDNVNRSSLSVYSDPHFLSNLMLSPDNYRVVAELYTTLQSVMNTNPDIFQIYMHNHLTGQSTQITSSVPRREFRTEPYEKPEHFSQGQVALGPVHPSHSYGFPPRPADLSEQHVITFYRAITNVPSDKQLALLAIDLKLDTIITICEPLFAPEEELFYLLDETGKVLYSVNEEDIGREFGDKKLLREITGNLNGYYDGEQAVSIYDKLELPFAGWTLVKQIPHQSLYKQSTKLTSIQAVIAFVTLLIVIFGTLWISIRITRPIQQLASYMNEVQSGKLNVEVDVNSPDEIGTLARRFRQMMDTINNLILREYRLELANKTNQLKALQAQIDPHFLYNALQSIGTLALQHKVPRIYALLSSLAGLMRYNMRNGEYMVTLKDEIGHLEKYMDLQQERFGDRLEVVWNIDPDVLSVPVPKMILQPVAENYFKHGKDSASGLASLSISAGMAGPGRLKVQLSNNGSSVDPKELERIQDILDDARASRGEVSEGEPLSSIGLQNVLLRLILYSDPTAELSIRNLEPQGVAVTLEFNVRGG
ncbi:cache domain-containing sensor histidine kinase [Paenibacillus lemnae]|uniref:Histidine kinase n=1 Tax=Paenibacillus lemnae TaxID=1330551 RepID=A0A848MC66_PAELE|nr:sensor histidine kinase [Paenibacillus lemnae]NMO98096.1 histidine kinase [Paenibacillus lemnae]